MKCIVSTACVLLSVMVAVSFAAPYFPTQFSASSHLQVGGGAHAPAANASAPSGGGLTEVLSMIDIPALLRTVNSFVKVVGVFCPPLSQVLDNVIQNVTSTAFRVFGRAILRQGLGGGGGGGGAGGGGGGSRVNVVLPTYPPDEDDEDYEEEDDEATSPGADDSFDLRISQSTPSSQNVSPANEENSVSKRHVRVVRAAEAEAEAEEEEEEEDQDGAESAPQPSEDLSNVDTDDTDRNKRYSPFGGQDAGHGGAGSGNFLFDIIRNTADRAARTVGTVYRMVAGTENVGWGLTTNSETSPTITTYGASAASSAKLVAGSGATEESDEKAGPGGVAEVDISKSVAVEHGHHGEGIPGPITRLFVIANRGIANLVQDLILRLAQTSERLVNFKARLVTSLI